MRDCDLVIVSGDLTNFGGVEDARKVISDVRRACPAVLALPGNLDQREVIPFLEADGIALHGKGRVIDGVGIFGCGGSNITPFGTPTELTEDEIYATLRAGYDFVRDVRPLLMICHHAAVRHQVRSNPSAASRSAARPRAVYRRGKARRLHLGAHPRIRRRRHDRADADSQRGPVQGRRLYSRPHDRRRAAGREARISLTCPHCPAPINRFACTLEKSPTDGRWFCATRSGYCGASGPDAPRNSAGIFSKGDSFQHGCD